MVNTQAKNKSFHSPLTVSSQLFDQWKKTIPEPFLSTLVVLKMAENFRTQSVLKKLRVQLSAFVKASTDHENCRSIANQVFRAILDTVECDSLHENPSHLPTEFYNLLRSLFRSVPMSTHQYILTSYLNETIAKIRSSGQQYATTHLLDLLLLRSLWDLPTETPLSSFYQLIMTGCFTVISQSCEKINNAGEADQSSIIHHSTNIETILQIILRSITHYKGELTAELSILAKEFEKPTGRPIANICALLSCLISILQLDNIQQESTTNAGLLVGQILSFLEKYDPALLLDQIFHSFLRNHLKESKTSIITFISNQTKVNFEFSSLPVQSKIAVYRGLCISTPGYILTRYIPSAASSSGQECVLLFDAIFPAILSTSVFLTVPLRKLIAFQTLRNACMKLYSLVNLPKEEVKRLLPSTTSCVTSTLLHVSPEFLFTIFYPKLVDICWRTWEYHYEPVLEQVNYSFECIINIQQKIIQLSENEEEIKVAKHFMENLLFDTLRTEWNEKGKYAIFTQVFRAIGSSGVLQSSESFSSELFLHFEFVSCFVSFSPPLINRREQQFSTKASNLLTSMIYHWNGFQSMGEEERKKKLSTKKKSAKIISSGLTPLSIFLKPFIEHLCSLNSILQYGMITYALPIVLEAFPSELPMILYAITQSGMKKLNARHMIALLSVLKHSRKLGTLSSSSLQELIATTPEIPIQKILHSGITSGDPILRYTTLESICESRSMSEPLSPIEVSLFHNFLRYSMRDSFGSHGRHEIGALLQKLMIRYKSNLRQQSSLLRYENSSKELTTFYCNFIRFVNCATNQIGICFYPRSPYMKMALAIYLYKQLILDIWNYKGFRASKCGVNPSDFIPLEELEKLDLFASHNIKTLLSGLWDSFDKTRELVFHTLLAFPSPLPHISFSEYRYYLRCALALIQSSRARNGEIGALLIRIAFFKYLQLLPTPLCPSFYVLVEIPSEELQHSLELTFPLQRWNANFRLFGELLFLLRKGIVQAQNSLESSCLEQSMHGILLTIQYLIVDLNISTQMEFEDLLLWRELITSLLASLSSIIQIAMNIISDMTTGDWTPTLSKDTYEQNKEPLLPCSDHDDGDVEDEAEYEELDSNKNQHIIIASWLLIKSVALLLGVIIKELPLQSISNGERYLLSNEQVQTSAESLLKILLSTTHKGVLEKTYFAFEMICQTLFHSQVPSLLTLPSEWLQLLFYKITHSSSMITRKSAGIPLAVCSILRSEASQSQTVHPYLSKVMDFLLALVQPSCGSQNTSQSGTASTSEITTVHGFNILRMILKDRILGSRIDPWIAKYFERTIEGLSHPSWAIRNAASLSFGILIRRTLGVAKRDNEEQRKSTKTTFSILFSRVAPMYPYLIHKFSQVLENMRNISTERSSLLIRQTSLFSLLIFLSRLSPSEAVFSSHNKFDTKPFIPLVLQCCKHVDFRVREMAARALIPLIPIRDVPSFLVKRILELKQTSFPFVAVFDSSYDDLSRNEVHGIVLQIFYLFKENVHCIKPEGELVDVLSRVLPHLFWMITSTCLSIAKAYLEVLYLLIERTNLLQKEEKLILNIFHFSRVVLSRKDSFAWQPMRSTFRNVISSFCCKQALQDPQRYTNGTGETTTALFASLLLDNDYEIRLQASYQMSIYLENSNIHSTIQWSIIQETILAQLLVETNENVTSHFFSLLARIPSPLPISMLCHTSSHWKHMASLIHSSISTLIHRTIIEYLGFFIFQMIEYRVDYDIECVTQWLRQVERYVGSLEGLEFRAAVLSSIISSRILTSHNTYIGDDSIVRCWLIASTLLEDDDEEIRKKTLSFLSQTTPLSSYSPASVSKMKTSSCTITVEVIFSLSLAKEAIFLLLLDRFSDNEFFHSYLYRVVCKEPVAMVVPSWESENVTLFTKELDNTWEEPLFLSHLATYVFSILVDTGKVGCIDDQTEMLVDAISRLSALVCSHLEVQRVVQTIPPFADQNWFLYTNRLILALFTLLSFPGNLVDDATALSLRNSLCMLADIPLAPIVCHSLSYLLKKCNEKIFSFDPIPPLFSSTFGVGFFFTTSFLQ